MMNSLLTCHMSEKFTVDRWNECLRFTVATTVTGDDSDDDDMVVSVPNNINLALPFAMVAKGKEGMLSEMGETIDRICGAVFFASGVDKLKAEVLGKLAKMDLSKYEAMHIPDPSKRVFH